VYLIIIYDNNNTIIKKSTREKFILNLKIAPRGKTSRRKIKRGGK